MSSRCIGWFASEDRMIEHLIKVAPSRTASKMAQSSYPYTDIRNKRLVATDHNYVSGHV